MSRLTLKKGGIIEKRHWDSDSREYKTEEVMPFNGNLFESCQLEEGVTLKDIFLHVKENIDFYDPLLGNWCEEIVNEGLSGKKPDPDDESSLDYLRLYWMYTYDSKEKRLEGDTNPNFDGVGKDDSGKETVYAIDFTPAYKMIDLPVILDKELIIHIRDSGYKYTKTDKYSNPGFTLGQIIYGIIWEMSFMGGPEDRDQKASEIFDSLKSVEEGTAELRTLDLEKFIAGEEDL